GSNAVLDVVAAGTGPLEYQWYFNGTPLSDGGNVSGSATAELTVADFQSANVGNYAVTVTNLAGAATGTAVINVLNPLVATQPQSQSVFAGATVNFSVTATGQSPLAYQWQFDGTNLPDATKALLVLSNVVVGQAGTYSVIITNSYGAIASSNATLAVTALAITSQPQNQSVLGGATASFAVTVNGQSPLAYQWLFNGTILSDATNNPLVLSNALVSESGTYSVIVTNAYGSIASSNATLTVTPLAITAQPTNRITWPNGSAIFKVNVSGAAPFNFEWQCNGVDVPGTWTNALTITNAQASQFGTYHVIVSNAYGSVTSSNAALLFSQVAVWGGNQGETNLPPGLTNIIAIAGCAPSTADCLALRSNGLAIHWPRTNYVAISNVVAIAGNGGQESYALLLKTNNVVYEWFLADDVTEFMGAFTNIAAIASFDYAPLALRTDGTLVAGNYYSTGGTGGIGTVTNIVNAVAIAEGASHGLALKADGTVVAWGSNTYGQTNVPPGLSNVFVIAAGQYDSLALIGNAPPSTQTILPNPTLGTNGFSLSLPTQSGKVYALEYKNSLADTNWTLLPLVPGGSGETLRDSAPTNSQRFYRVQQW
ncbi:MAG TPA: immunoglobulin domain-containing protein, partial [Verrucomicrobiae bacterium]|nr:immunoglobulin domain-containing protein [Verrucomicrobiae bacterium]